MLITVATPEAEKYLIFDCVGHVIPCVTSFDTETKEIELMIRVQEQVKNNKEDEPTSRIVPLMQEVTNEDGTTDSAPILVKFKLLGAYARKDGKPIEE